MQNLVLRRQRPAQWRVGLAISVFSLATFSPFAWSATPYSGMDGMPWSSGFSPWNMGNFPGSSGFSPWSMGGFPGSSGFSPWSMGGFPGSSGFSPWGGNGWNSSIWPWSGSGWGNSWGNNSWMPWSNNSNFFGRRNNNDWVTQMFLMNALNNQTAFNRGGIPPVFPSEANTWNQRLPAPQPQTVFYPQSPTPSQLANTPNSATEQNTQPANTVVDFPATRSSFSPFLESSGNSNPAISTPIVPDSSEPHFKPQAKTLVFPDGSRY